MNVCKRVQQRIECPECGYPASESLYWLDGTGSAVGHEERIKWYGQPGIYRDTAYQDEEAILDPGHTEETEQ